MLKDDVRWKLAKNPGINTWTAIAKTWSQYDNAMDNAKCKFFVFLVVVLKMNHIVIFVLISLTLRKQFILLCLVFRAIFLHFCEFSFQNPSIVF